MAAHSVCCACWAYTWLAVAPVSPRYLTAVRPVARTGSSLGRTAVQVLVDIGATANCVDAPLAKCTLCAVCQGDNVLNASLLAQVCGPQAACPYTQLTSLHVCAVCVEECMALHCRRWQQCCKVKG